jgi:tetratricopeptide (TPR) repeat protein
VVQELADSTNPTLQRAFDLLKALTLFPQGEQLTRIKRFFAIYAFFPVHARELLDQGLIDASVNQRLGTDGADASAKMLVVPRPIRECVRDRIGPDELTRLNRKAADLYFGQGWPSGVLKQHSGYHFDDPHCPSAYIANATTIIIRLLRESRSTENLQAIAAALRLTSSYIAALSNGDHYRSVVSICKDTIALVPDSGFEQQRSLLNYELGKALRMIGEHKRAKAVLEDAAGFKHSKSTRQSILLSLAFCHQALDESDEAIAAAKEVIKIDRYSGPALQGQTILVDLTEESAQREQKLERLEALSRKRGALVVANNIALSRAEDADGEPDRVRSILGRVLQSAGNSEDFYNETRAMIGLSELALNAGERLSDADQSRLIGSYHFLFNERFSSLFDRCHAALWKTFSARNDLNNLLSLFRHSSLVWRLRGHEKMEKKYLGQLKKKGGERIVERF